MMADLTLIPIARAIHPVTTAVLYAKEARKYLRISAGEFHRLVSDGVLVRRVHIRGKRPFFLKHELDSYLESTPRYTIRPRENSPNATERKS